MVILQVGFCYALHVGTVVWAAVVACPGNQRDVDQGSGTTPGHAAEAYAAVKAAKFADQDNFIPFILETGGWTCQQSGP